ncbi:MAG: WD domain protein [Sclerophora amabilis]|nr:MAG: WD domain protein [Sclerophora amabilis]
MSVSVSPTGYEAYGDGERSPKRRRLGDGYDQRLESSSPDELAVASGYDSATAESRTDDVHKGRLRNGNDLYSDPEAASESPDELDRTFSPDGHDRLDLGSEKSPIAPDEELGESIQPALRRPKMLNYKQRLLLKGHKKGVSVIRLAADATIKIWDATTGKHLQTMEGHLAGISTLAWSPDSKTLATGSDDKSIRLWDVSTGKPYPMPLIGHQNYIYSIAFSPKGNMLVSGSYDEAVFLWDVRSGRCMRSLPAHSDPVGGVDFVRDGTLVVSCAGDGLIRVWDTATGQCLRTLVHEDNPPVTSVLFSPNGKFVLAWTLDSSVRLWNYVEGRCVKTYQGHQNNRFSLGGAFGRYGDEAFIVSGSEDGSMVIWDVKSKVILQRLQGHEGPVLGVDTCQSENILVSCGLDGTVRIWRDSGESEDDQ